MQKIINHVVQEKQPNKDDLDKVPVIKTAYPNYLPEWADKFIPSTHPEA